MRVTVDQIAEAALTREGGVTIPFDNEDYETPRNCKKEAIRFRNSFNAVKAKERREANRHGGVARFERLGCYIEQASAGWRVTVKENSFVVKETALTHDLKDVYWKQLQAIASSCMEKLDSPVKPCPFTEEEERFFWLHNPVMARRVYEDRYLRWPLPAFVERELT